jgi:short-subunit dehydrogenase
VSPVQPSALPDFEAVRALPDEVLRSHGEVHLLINNAGVGLVAPVKDMTIEDFQWVMDINFWSVVHCVQAFLPHMIERESHIVNVASVFAFWAAPGESAYTASKFAMRGFGEALEQELYSTPVSVSTVYPGAVKTEIAKNARYGGAIGPLTDAKQAEEWFNFFARTSSPQAARAIVRGIRKNKRRILVGADARLLDLIQRLLPSMYQNLFPLALRL